MKTTVLILSPLLLALAACSPPPQTGWSGYAEGETLYLAAPVAGRLSELAVHSGDTVQAEQALFKLEDSLERAADAEAQARERSAAAQARNGDKGRRREELAITEAQLRQARAQAELARSELARQQQLLAQGFVQKARVDDAVLQSRQADARVAELDAAVQTARLPARDDERAAAQALAQAAAQGRAQTDWRLQQKAQRAPQAGLVTDVFYRPGEWVNAGAPVLSLLPASQRKARFFVPEAQLGAIKAGQLVQLRCDGCGAPIAARISYIAPQAEFTPPVIYSNAQRAKLVFMVEARPEKAEDALRLHPGQPLDVQP
ncbi:HlyD family efflux transporter periplasmic adaptor subunit [Pelomonas sp. SE-A7]|uniref:HlyD family secretion protein n=1 Tax=Pelomonas sp. SE-A7 TaxID=3054953 RepID=UPI00259CD7CE|nr:HlyD family efflux transporter periplasmic adaptor subunit [Pelomonas sp. SE-A7]MDM4766933.1 HlyD family efflux transporter periplasmic adaptor subunit [Pelomonas sp. SE-A7]